MKRLLPYRDYSEHDVVNLFSLAVADDQDLTKWVENSTEVSIGNWDSGVVVKVKAADLPGDMHSTSAGQATSGALRSYLGSNPTSAHIGFNAYPYNGMTVEAAGAGESDKAIGITLRETLAYDENGEKLLYYKQKLDEAQAVLPGQTVPVLTRGTVLLAAKAFAAAPDLTTNNLIYVAANGQLTKTQTASEAPVGKLLAIGKESDDEDTKKYLVQLSF